MAYQYKLYGLKLQSEIKLGVFPVTNFEENPDVTLVLGKVAAPADNQKDTAYKPFSTINSKEFYLDITGVAVYLVSGSDSITVDKYEESNWRDVVAFLYDTVFSIVLIKNDRFVFHASAVKWKGKAYIFCCASGDGKSTLAARLMEEGAELIEDDRCLIEWNEVNQSFSIRNYYPFLELWPNFRFKKFKEKFNIEPICKIRDGIRKFRFDVSEICNKESTPVKKMFLIARNNQENEIEMKEITGMAKVTVAKKFSHFDYLMPLLGKSKEQFSYLAKMLNNIEVIHLNRSRETEIKDFVNFIQNEID